MPKSDSLVVSSPGQPSAELIAKLKLVGTQLSDNQVLKALDYAESTRTAFQSSAIIAGVLLLAKKQSLPHGKWTPWCEEIGGQLAAKLARSCHSYGQTAPRTIRKYCFLAQHFLADLEQRNFAPDWRDAPRQVPNVAPEDVLAVESLDHDRRGAVLREVESFVAGRSLDRMLMDFRRAETAADREQVEECATKKKPRPADPAQLDFWDEINRPLTELHTLMTNPDFIERTTREGWLKLAAELTAQAKEAKAMAEKIR